jgi:hypothetical protein
LVAVKGLPNVAAFLCDDDDWLPEECGLQCEVSYTDNLGVVQTTTIGSAVSFPSQSTVDNQATIWAHSGDTITVYIYNPVTSAGSGIAYGTATISELT